ncbi:MAG: hypothetical protein H5T85_06945, partial [Actinobacteria bacterium]|nr:hypothetical protein [Actinomycetota bacterium]
MSVIYMNAEYMNSELDSVSKKILEDANLEREKILDEARKKADAIIEEANRERKKILEEGRKRAEERYKEVYNLEIMKAKSEFNRRLLLLKLKYVDEVISLAKQRLSNIEREKCLLFLRKAIKDLEITGGEYSIGYKEM